MPKQSTMTVSARVSAFFKSDTLNSWRKNKADRNAHLVQFFYGLLPLSELPDHAPAWPTLEDTGKLWGNMTRERARQIIHNNFVARVSASDFPELKEVTTLLATKRFWPHSQLRKALLDRGLVEASFNLKGLFNLMDDLGIRHGYSIMTPELASVSRANHAAFDELFIIDDELLLSLDDAYKQAKKIAPRCGVAQIAYTQPNTPTNELYHALVWLFKHHPSVWFYEEKISRTEYRHWYTFESMNNTLVSYAEKVFHILQPTTSKRCAEGFSNALHSRSYKHPYPPTQIINLFLQGCRHFHYDAQTDLLTLIGREMPMTDIEHAVVSYLERHGQVKFHDFLDHLKRLGYGEPLAKKNITFSPFIFVDRAQGRKSHTYELLSPVKESVS